ncbi:MAG: hypothetical protein L3K23_06170 [Thermoplasmata archaeon]|nr:hypothetical protein [Thermoplasmata archaeon]
MADENGADESPTAAPPRSPSKKVKAKPRRGRGPARPFPNMAFEDALVLGTAIQEHGAGQRIRLLTLFDKMGKSPSSGPSRSLVTESSRYGITEGSYKAEYLTLTEIGSIATSTESSPKEQLRARFQLAIESIPVFKSLYESLVGSKIPAREVLRDRAGEFGVEGQGDQAACVDVFLVNVKFLGLLKVLSGAERIVNLDHALDELPAGKIGSAPVLAVPASVADLGTPESAEVDYSKVAFFIAPIGEPDTEHRHHSDMMLGSLVEKALEGTGLTVVRADKITKPGMINAQVIEYVLRSAVVVADLSFENPNVFYELALRHVTGLPTVHIMRAEDRKPFDVASFRTITIDTSDKYKLVAQLDSYRSAIAAHVRQALEGGAGQTNPILAFRPNLKLVIG